MSSQEFIIILRVDTLVNAVVLHWLQHAALRFLYDSVVHSRAVPHLTGLRWPGDRSSELPVPFPQPEPQEIIIFYNAVPGVSYVYSFTYNKRMSSFDAQVVILSQIECLSHSRIPHSSLMYLSIASHVLLSMMTGL